MEVRNFKVEGLKELQDFMSKELPAATNRRVVLSGMRTAAKPTLAAAKFKAKKRSHALEESLGFQSVTKNKSVREGHFATLLMGPLISGPKAMQAYLKYIAFYGKPVRAVGSNGKLNVRQIGRIRHAHLVEFGYMARSKGGGTRTRVPASPFLRPAFDENAGTFVNTFTGIMRKKIEAAVKKKRRGRRR